MCLNYVHIEVSFVFFCSGQIIFGMPLRRVRKKVDYAKFCEDEDERTNNSDGKQSLSCLSNGMKRNSKLSLQGIQKIETKQHGSPFFKNPKSGHR